MSFACLSYIGTATVLGLHVEDGAVFLLLGPLGLLVYLRCLKGFNWGGVCAVAMPCSDRAASVISGWFFLVLLEPTPLLGGSSVKSSVCGSPQKGSLCAKKGLAWLHQRCPHPAQKRPSGAWRRRVGRGEMWARCKNSCRRQVCECGCFSPLQSSPPAEILLTGGAEAASKAQPKEKGWRGSWQNRPTHPCRASLCMGTGGNAHPAWHR